MTNRPPPGLFRRLLFLWRRFWCPHSRVFVFFPGYDMGDVVWERDGRGMGLLTRGARVNCCQDCGETWGENYAE